MANKKDGDDVFTLPTFPKGQRQQILDQVAAEEAGIIDHGNPKDGQIYAGYSKKERLLAESKSKDLKYMNDRYAMVHNVGGKCMVMTNVYNEYYKKYLVQFVAPDTIALLYSNQYPEEMENEKVKIPLGKWWIGHIHRRDYETVTFEPDKPSGEYIQDDYYNSGEKRAYYNTWQGLAIEEKQGCWELTKNHIREVLCNDDPIKFDYVIKWFAWLVQHPDERAQVVMIFKGGKGAGKSVILNAFADIFGQHGFVTASRDHLVGKHNDHLSTAVYLFADEAYQPGDKEVEGKLKSLITEPMMAVEPKFRGVKICKNCLHIVMATNNNWVVPVTSEERRYFINEVSDKYLRGKLPEEERISYFKALWGEILGEGKAAMLYDLRRIELGNWHPSHAIPETAEMRKQQLLSLPRNHQVVLALLEDGIFPGKEDYTISLKHLILHFENDDRVTKIAAKGMKQFLTELGCSARREMNKPRVLVFPELGEMRKTWDDQIGKHDWPPMEKWEVKTMIEAKTEY